MSIHVLCQVELYSEGDMLGLSQTSLFLFHGHTESLHDVGPCSQTLVEAVHEYHATVGQLWGVVLGHHLGIHATQVTRRLLPLLVLPHDPFQRGILGSCTALRVLFHTFYNIWELTAKLSALLLIRFEVLTFISTIFQEPLHINFVGRGLLLINGLTFLVLKLFETILHWWTIFLYGSSFSNTKM